MKSVKRKALAHIRMAVIYTLLLILGFVYLYPICYALLQSFMSPEDIHNPMVHFVPSLFTLDNYRLLLDRMGYFASIGYSSYLSAASSLISALACGLMGYALSRFDFKLKKLYLALILTCFIIPPQVLMIPTYLGYSQLGLLGSEAAFFLPAALGQGLKSPIFILIFYSFFNTIPKSLDEAGKIDGCSPLHVFIRILAPLTIPAFTLVFIFSTVWYWNETYLTSLYIGDSVRTLPNSIALVLSSLEEEAMRDPMMARINLPIRMASVILAIIPLIVFYLILQRQFVESIDRTGITGE